MSDDEETGNGGPEFGGQYVTKLALNCSQCARGCPGKPAASCYKSIEIWQP